MSKYIDKLTEAQVRLARWLALTGAAPSFSQACRAIAERDPIVAEWKRIAQQKTNEQRKGEQA